MGWIFDEMRREKLRVSKFLIGNETLGIQRRMSDDQIVIILYD